MLIPKTQNKPKVTILNRDEVKAIITDMPVNGFKIPDWLEKQFKDTTDAVEMAVREGMRQGDTQSQIAARINKTLDISKGHASNLARTAVNQTKTDIKFETYETVPELTDSYRWIAELDSRTCPRCRPLDGKIFKYKDPKAPRPQLHINCRCTIDPEIDWDGMGLEEPKMRRKADGDELEVIDANESYEDWFKKQSKSFQSDVIKSPQKLDWFRQGKITLADMIKHDGSELSIAELMKLLLRKGKFHKPHK